ncbi:MAG: hypothetical protein IJV31_09250 [Clostridia bacterium]|nr:hypothetical protein [Clostridia bacterium]
MAWTKLSEKQKANWVNMNKFAEEFDLKKTKAYELVKLPEMQRAVRRFGERTIRVNLPMADEILAQIYR